MLVKLEVQNFRSILDRKVFHMISRNYKRFPNHIHDYNENLGVLKTAGIYGGNGSGKSNMLKSLYLVKKIVEDAEFLDSPKAQRLFTPFRLNSESITQDSIFQVDFIAADILYRYDLTINSSSNSIKFESLSKIGKNIDKVIFTRSFDDLNGLHIDFPSFSKHIEVLSNLINKIPFISILSTNLINDTDLLNAQNWFVNQIEFSFPEYNEYDIVYTLTLNEDYLKMANKMVQFSNLGIKEIKVEEINKDVVLQGETIDFIESKLKRNNYYAYRDSNQEYITAVKSEDGFKLLKLIAIHETDNNEPVKMAMMQESRGTLLFIQNLLPAIILSQAKGVNYFIDEINRSLHPILIREILSQYYQNISEESEGQIIFTTHEDFIMDESMMRQDEIWFVEKDNNGKTDIFPLSDFTNVRFDLNLKKNYLNGKFGAVPFKNEPSKINLHAN